MIAVFLALLISCIITNDISGTLFRKLRLTQRTSRSSLWADVFHQYGGVVLVHLGDGRRVEGWLRYYSDEPAPSSLFLVNAAWVTDENKLILIDGPGIFITQEMDIRIIEFLHLKQPETPRA